MLLLDHHLTTHGGDNYGDILNKDASVGAWPELLRLAAHHGKAHMVHLIIDLGFDLGRFPDIGHISLRKAAENGWLSIARILVEMGVDGDGAGGEMAPAVLASAYGREDMVALLVQLGAKSMVRRQDGSDKVIIDGVSYDNSRIMIWGAGTKEKIDYKRW